MEKHFTSPTLVGKLNLANEITISHIRFYTVIFGQCINRSSKLQKIIVVTCDELGELTNTYLAYIQVATYYSSVPDQKFFIWFEKSKLTNHLSHILQMANQLLISHRQDSL